VVPAAGGRGGCETAAVVAHLAQRWSDLTAELGWAPEAARQAGDAVTTAYGQAQRHYHTVEHLAAVLSTLDELTAPRRPSAAARLAAWFHDAVYEPARFDNEERSAELAEAALVALGTDPALVAEVAALVLATKRHDDPGPGARPDHLAMLDADMAILGRGAATYDRYAAGIRAEYAHLPDAVYRPARAAVLRGFLERDAIYLTAAATQRFEAAARRNIAAEIAGLDAPAAS
jgi:predicted metal-dependent HD superfamily phosphohydrolase